MFSLLITTTPENHNILIAELWEAGALGITEEQDHLQAFFDGEPAIALENLAKCNPTLAEADDRDWVRFAQDQWSAFPVGERFYLVPEWLDDAAPDGRIRLRMHPGMACGSGTHPATRLCLTAMENHIVPGHSVLDVGTGAGILADAASLLGAAPVFGCDILHESTMVAQSNVGGHIALFTGSVRSVRTSAVDWAVCNLNAATLSTIGEELKRVAPRLILSGFREEETASVASLFPREILEDFELEGYACIVLQ